MISLKEMIDVIKAIEGRFIDGVHVKAVVTNPLHNDFPWVVVWYDNVACRVGFDDLNKFSTVEEAIDKTEQMLAKNHQYFSKK